MRWNRCPNAFTLIEILLAVAVVALLTLVALPRYERAQARSKVSQAKSDLRRCAGALEAYAADNNHLYPPDNFGSGGYPQLYPSIGIWHLIPVLTTPVAYLPSVDNLVDPFVADEPPSTNGYRYINLRYTYVDHRSTPYYSTYEAYRAVVGEWILTSDGPDKSFGPSGSFASPPRSFLLVELYDPTNGTKSPGDIVRTQIDPEGYTIPSP